METVTSHEAMFSFPRNILSWIRTVPLNVHKQIVSSVYEPFSFFRSFKKEYHLVKMI